LFVLVFVVIRCCDRDELFVFFLLLQCVNTNEVTSCDSLDGNHCGSIAVTGKKCIADNSVAGKECREKACSEIGAIDADSLSSEYEV
jgi:hypothetical protein